MLIKQSPLLLRNLALGTFGELLILFSIKVNLLYLPYSTVWRCCLLHLIKQNFAKNFSKNSNLDDLGISLPVFPYRTNLILELSGPDCIPVVVLTNCEPELSYILAELCNKCLKESCFRECWKVSLVVPIFKNVGERSTATNYWPVSLLSMVSKVVEKLVNNRIVDHLEKCGLFSDFQYGFRSSQLTTNLLRVESDRIARALNRSGVM